MALETALRVTINPSVVVLAVLCTPPPEPARPLTVPTAFSGSGMHSPSESSQVRGFTDGQHQMAGHWVAWASRMTWVHPGTKMVQEQTLNRVRPCQPSATSWVGACLWACLDSFHPTPFPLRPLESNFSVIQGPQSSLNHLARVQCQ